MKMRCDSPLRQENIAPQHNFWIIAAENPQIFAKNSITMRIVAELRDQFPIMIARTSRLGCSA
jgi:hypothetical protein